MTSRTIVTTGADTVGLTADSEFLYVIAGVTIYESDQTAVAAADGNRLSNFGTILATAAKGTAVLLGGTNGEMDNHGAISAGAVGILLDAPLAADTNFVTNSGSVAGGAAAIELAGGHGSIVNAGLLSGAIGLQVTGGTLDLLNTGSIVGHGRAIALEASAGPAAIDNLGTIAGAIQGGAQVETIVNAGLIEGAVSLGGGDDVYDGRDGRVRGIVLGEAGNDWLAGGAGAETLQGGDGDDEIAGGAGNDVIEGGAGGDYLDGGDGFDIVSYASAPAAVLVDLVDPLANLGAALEDDLQGFEGARGSAFNDTLSGNDQANELIGGAGNDRLVGLRGNDTMRGGAGNDQYSVADPGDRVIEAAGGGNDTVFTAVSLRLTLSSEVEAITVTAGAGALNIWGSNSANLIGGSSAANLLAGLGGADTLQGGDGADTLQGGEGNDQLQGGNGQDNLIGGNGADTLTGGADARDRLQGGAGADLFTYDTPGQTTMDYINDFVVAEDTIRIAAALVPGLAPGALGAGMLAIVTSATTSSLTLPGQRLLFETATGILRYDADGNVGGTDLTQYVGQIQALTGTLTVADFFVF